MKIRNTPYYKILSLLVVTTLALTGCRDDELYPSGNRRDPNAIAFSAYAMPAQEDPDARSGEEPEYEPLVLTGEGFDRPLYLHTWDSDQIGYRPGEHSDTVAARGCQVTTADGLKKFHKTFRVFASLTADGKTYIPWTDTRNSANADNIWYTEGTHYWPGEEMLDFRAVSPAAEFDNLVDLALTENTVRFSYTARKGDADNDAEHQPDLLFAGSTCNKPGSVEGCAPLKFHHALSAVKFAIRDVMGGEVVNVKIANVKSKGNCVYTVDPETGLGSFEWTDQQGSETYSQNFNYDFTDRIVDPSDDTQDEVLNDRMPEKTFMMIPQEISPEAEIIVTLKRNGMTPEEVTLRGKILDNNVTEWKPGHEYVYTISTSKSNWVYEFRATGNHNSLNKEHNVDGDQIYVYSPSDIVHDLYNDNAYFTVHSLRYRANNQRYVEALPWVASHGGSHQYDGVGEVVENRDIKAEEWITPRAALIGEGINTDERKDITMLEHHILSTWQGDRDMQNLTAYPGNSETNPWDLSMAAGIRNTANSYVIDREGWYCFPLVYGNAVTNGDDNKDAYTCNRSGSIMKQFSNHISGGHISSPYLPVNYRKSAGIVWSDVYNAISDVGIRDVMKTDGTTETMVVFHANKYNMQQGNVVIAAYDNADPTIGTITWSWHIWITEHWLNSSGVSNAFDKADVPFSPAVGSDWRDRGDLLIDNNDVSGDYGYYLAPYNLGWCDPKHIDYLRRNSVMTFVQKKRDGTDTGLTASLTIIQDGARVSYKVGNNPYYQWGRKDPMVGFVDHTNTVKRNFGPRQYGKGAQPKGVWQSITEPQVLYCKGALAANDWSDTRYDNLWNNSDSETKVKKTVYDPCPPGYMMPPAYCFRFIGKCNPGWLDWGVAQGPSYWNSGSTSLPPLLYYNGELKEEDDPYTFIVSTVKNKTRNPATSIWLTGTGNRWYTDYHPSLKDPNGNLIKGGDNFNPTLVYLWSTDPWESSEGLGLGFGLDSQFIPDPAHPENVDVSNSKFAMTPYFKGRRAMARPVRPIREQ